MAEVVVVGAGVVGTATGLGLIEHGHDVTFIDVDGARLRALRKDGYNAIKPVDIDIARIDAAILAVTALTGEHGIDLSHLLAATRNLGEKLATDYTNFPTIIFRCTMPPGTMRTILIPLLEEVSGKKAGEDFGVVYNPEYLRAISAEEDFLHPRVITVGTHERGDRSHQAFEQIMGNFNAPIHWLSFEAAEFQKYVNNVFNAVKISAFNWFRLLAKKLDIEPDVIDECFELCVLSGEGLWNAKYGTRDYGPYDGVCLPKDTEALRHFADQLGIDTSLLDAVQKVNRDLGGK